MIRFTELVRDLPATVPFVGPEAQERSRGRAFRARIGANESVFGPSPKAKAAMQSAVATCWQYGDPENHELKQALAQHHGVAMENIVVGEGIDGLLGYLVRMLVEPGARVVTSLGAYPTFNFHVAGYGGELVTVPYRDDHEDLGGLMNIARSVEAAIVYLSNPDNPMGTAHGADDIVAALDRLPEGCLLVLDEAYVDCAGPEFEPPINPDDDRVIRMRTFSKVHGMAGARGGICHRPSAIDRRLQQGEKSLRHVPDFPNRGFGIVARPRLPDVGDPEDRLRPKSNLRNCGRKRPGVRSLASEFRGRGLRKRRCIRAPGSGSTVGAGCVRANAFCRTTRPVHQDFRRNRGRSNLACRITARGNPGCRHLTIQEILLVTPGIRRIPVGLVALASLSISS